MVDEDVVKKLFDEIAPKYTDRQGGYTRIIKTGVRQGDAAPMVIIELVNKLVRKKRSCRKTAPFLQSVGRRSPRTQMPLRGVRLKLTTTLRETLSA